LTLTALANFVRPTFIEYPNVKGCHTIGPKGLAHRVLRPLKQLRSLNCKSFWKISALTHPFSLHKTSARVWRSTQVKVSSTSVSRSLHRSVLGATGFVGLRVEVQY